MRTASIQESSSGCEKALRTYVLESSFSNAARERGERERKREREGRESKRIKRDGSKRDAERERERGGERGLTEDKGIRSCVVMSSLNTASL